MTMTALATALASCAAGLYPLEAGVALLIAEGTFLRRDDFTTRFIEHGTSGGTPMAAIDWDAAITALNTGGIPCSAGERRILQAAASIAQEPPPTSATSPPASTPQHPEAHHRHHPSSRTIATSQGNGHSHTNR